MYIQYAYIIIFSIDAEEYHSFWFSSSQFSILNLYIKTKGVDWFLLSYHQPSTLNELRTTCVFCHLFLKILAILQFMDHSSNRFKMSFPSIPDYICLIFMMAFIQFLLFLLDSFLSLKSFFLLLSKHFCKANHWSLSLFRNHDFSYFLSITQTILKHGF